VWVAFQVVHVWTVDEYIDGGQATEDRGQRAELKSTLQNFEVRTSKFEVDERLTARREF
jgi:hypothetical protein